MKVHVRSAADKGDLKELQQLALTGVYCDNGDIEAAARNGHVHVLKWFEKYFFLPRERITIAAASAGQVAVLDWLEESFPEDKPYWMAAGTAAADGQLEAVQWFMQRGIKPTKLGIDAAVEEDHWDVLEYLFEQGIFPCDHKEYAADKALEQHRWHALELLSEQEIYPSEECIQEMQSEKDTQALKWLCEHKLI